MNYPPGMSRRDYDHVEGVSRCHCGAVLPEEVDCGDCGGKGRHMQQDDDNRLKPVWKECDTCRGTGKVSFEGEECPDGCMDEPDPDRQRDEQWERDHDPHREAFDA